MAANGASREALYGVVRTSLEAWPSESPAHVGR